jgi:hypothetical protein
LEEGHENEQAYLDEEIIESIFACLNIYEMIRKRFGGGASWR